MYFPIIVVCEFNEQKSLDIKLDCAADVWHNVATK